MKVGGKSYRSIWLEPDGRSTGRQAVLYTAALVPMSLMPTLVGLASPWYLMGALTLGAILMLFSMEFASTRTMPAESRSTRPSARSGRLPRALEPPAPCPSP